MEYQKTVVLKDGRQCLLRSGTKNDGAAALRDFIRTHEETDYLLSYPDEISITPEQESGYLQEKAESGRAAEILAELDGEIVGTAGIEALGNKYKLRHRCQFGISVEKAFWGLGIGRALLEACIECAVKAGFQQMELDVAAENTRAIEMYRRAGFVEYGRNPKGFLSRISGYQELVLMYLDLEQLPSC